MTFLHCRKPSSRRGSASCVTDSACSGRPFTNAPGRDGEGSWHSSHERRSFVSMTADFKTKLQALLQAHAAQAANQHPADKTPRDQADRRMCGERLHAVVRPVLEGLI